MAGRGGRGGGRGRGMSFSVEALGFTRGEALPTPIFQPPPLFPPLESKPVPLLTGEVEEYILALKQELRGTFQSSGFYLQPASKKKDVQRYSDRYQQRTTSNGNTVRFEWSRLPQELHPPKPKRKLSHAGGTSSSKKPKKVKSNVDISKTLEALEEGEKNSSGEEEQEEEKNEDEEENEAEEELDEEDVEEDTDYAFTYFDNGENYGDDEDDNLDDGPTY